MKTMARLLALCIVAVLVAATADAMTGGRMNYKALRSGAIPDTLFGVDSVDVNTSFVNLQELDWVHYLAPTFAGGDSAGLASVQLWLSNDGATFYNSGTTLFAAATPDTTGSRIFSPPFVRTIRLRFVSAANNDTLIIGGYHIYK